jgi:hypothetical protein
MVLRGCIESALYGFYLSKNKNSHETWLNRHASEKALKLVNDEFKIVNLFAVLKTTDLQIHDAAKILYDRTIDFGAHPNELALTSLLRKNEEEDLIQFDLLYLSGDTPAFRFALKTTAQIGLCALLIFKNVYSKRFSLLGLDEKLARLKVEP